MKTKSILIAISLCLILVAPFVFGLGGGTAIKWEVFRTVTSTEDTQLAASTQKTSPSPAADGTVSLGSNVGAIHIRFKGTTAENKTLSWTIWAYKGGGDAAEYVAHGTATTGLTQTGVTNEFYCDTIAITTQAWLKTVGVADGAPDAIVSAGGITKLIFDSCEYEIFKVIIRDIAGGGSEAATAGADIANFN